MKAHLGRTNTKRGRSQVYRQTAKKNVTCQAQAIPKIYKFHEKVGGGGEDCRGPREIRAMWIQKKERGVGEGPSAKKIEQQNKTSCKKKKRKDTIKATRPGGTWEE